MQDNELPIAITKRLPEQIRWVNLDAYGVKLRLAAYKVGYMLVAENGEAHPDKMAELGFLKIGNDWAKPEVSFAPRDFKRLFPEMTVVTTPSQDVILDRLSLELPDEARIKPASAISKRIVEKTQGTTIELPRVKVWFAQAELGDHTVQAFGASPEEAMRALVDTWMDQAKRENEDASLLSRYRDSVTVSPAETGRGYAKGMGDSGWYKGLLSGADERFDEIVAAVPTVSKTWGFAP